jgi:AraC family transcriptional regulator
MNAQPDTFVAFLDVLAADLDDHEARPEDLAARLHLSRYHFACPASARSTP